MTKKDMKEGLSSARKADVTHIRTPLLVYGARACEYGDDKYERSNCHRPMPNIQADFKRFRAYLRAVISHTMYVLDQMEYHQSTDYELQDIEGMKEACYAIDTDFKEGQAIAASGLPHICGAVASLNIAITQAVRAGLLPADPGTPWKSAVPQPQLESHAVIEEANLRAQEELQKQKQAPTPFHDKHATRVSIEKDHRGVPKVTIFCYGFDRQGRPCTRSFGHHGGCNGGYGA